ncbi:MmcB family DNA repair protein [Acinetobacter radioresistens]|uniref:MmcB family DNA repair protein n=1 Tax=Acinetobacter radioresistens TaxID=40216 RepID=UPI0020065374
MEKLFTHDELVQIAAKWAKRVKRFPVVVTEMKCIGSREQPDVLAFTANSSLMIECKTSMADFRADFKKPERIGLLNAIGNYRLYMAPKGIIRSDLIPEGWGFLEVAEDGSVEVINFKKGNIYNGNHTPEEYRHNDPFFHLSDMAKERSFLYSMLIRKN